MSHTASESSSSLLRRAQQKDSEAWRRLVQLYGPVVYGGVRRNGLKEHDAADVVQEVFQAAFVNRTRFAVGQPNSHFRKWLWTIAHRRTCDRLRHDQKQALAAGGTDALRRLEQLAETPPGEESQEAASIRAALVRNALQLLRPEFADHTWQACLQTTLAGRDPADVAKELSMSVGAVYVARSRVMRRIREELEDLL